MTTSLYSIAVMFLARVPFFVWYEAFWPLQPLTACSLVTLNLLVPA
jgi:hypothetical protein